MFDTRHNTDNRRGGVYIAVLGTSLIVAVLALSALTLQRVQNRMMTASADVRQAQLNAEAAVELGLLAIQQNENWRSDFANGAWFSSRSTGAGSCTLQVVDPLDADLADDASEPIVMTGIGNSGSAEQRVVRTVDSYSEALACLRSSVAIGDAISLSGSVLRATNSGLISANSTSATSSTVYGNVQATSISGSTYSGTTTQIAAADRPEMPDWSTVFGYYFDNGTSIDVSSLPTTTPNLAYNPGIEYGPATPVQDWTGVPPGGETATLAKSTLWSKSGLSSLRVLSRSNSSAGPAQLIDNYVIPGQPYYVEVWAYTPIDIPGGLLGGLTKVLQISIHTKGTGSSESQVSSLPIPVVVGVPTLLSATLTAPSWSGSLEYAYIKVSGLDIPVASPYHIDDLLVLEATSGRFIYRQVLGPGVNTLNPTSLNSQGIYKIDCGGSRIVIERSRIKGTLLLINPGAGSCITGPISWSPAMAGYPALLVDADTASDADFTIGATNRVLSEAENGINYNPAGASHEEFGQDSDAVDTFPSQIEGLIVVRDDVFYQNNTLVRGQVIAGDDLSSSNGALEVDYRPDALFSPPPGFSDSPTQASRPLSIRKAVLP